VQVLHSCSVLQCVAMQFVGELCVQALHICNILQCVALYCTVLHCIAMCRNVLQFVAICLGLVFNLAKSAACRYDPCGCTVAVCCNVL